MSGGKPMGVSGEMLIEPSPGADIEESVDVVYPDGDGSGVG
jgi:hypothetical protein